MNIMFPPIMQNNPRLQKLMSEQRQVIDVTDDLIETAINLLSSLKQKLQILLMSIREDINNPLSNENHRVNNWIGRCNTIGLPLTAKLGTQYIAKKEAQPIKNIVANINEALKECIDVSIKKGWWDEIKKIFEKNNHGININTITHNGRGLLANLLRCRLNDPKEYKEILIVLKKSWSRPQPSR